MPDRGAYSARVYATRHAAARAGARLAQRFGCDPTPARTLATGSLDGALEAAASLLESLDHATAPAAPVALIAWPSSAPRARTDPRVSSSLLQ